jgi:hypothetical protein
MKQNTTVIALRLNHRTDADILSAIQKAPGDSMQGKVKTLIRDSTRAHVSGTNGYEMT